MLIIYFGDPYMRIPVDLTSLNSFQHFVYFGRKLDKLTFHDILRYCFIKHFGLRRACNVFFATQNDQVLRAVDFESRLSHYPDQNTFYLYDRTRCPSNLIPPVPVRPVLRDRICDVVSKITAPYYYMIPIVTIVLLTLLASWLLSPRRNREMPSTMVPVPTVIQTIGIQQPTLSPFMQPTPTSFVPQTSPTATTYRVRPGDTLWDIAERFCGDGTQWRLIAKTNNIDNPRNLRVGTILTIPSCEQ